MIPMTPWARPPFAGSRSLPTESPVGSVTAFAGQLSTAFLQGGSWLYCDGSSVSQSFYPHLFLALGDIYGPADNGMFTLPDYRGQFQRGLDTTDQQPPVDPGISSRTNTAGDAYSGVGSLQKDQFLEHEHQYTPNPNESTALSPEGGPIPTIALATEAETTAVVCPATTPAETDSCYGAETRPKNIYVYYLIKARLETRIMAVPAWHGRRRP